MKTERLKKLPYPYLFGGVPLTAVTVSEAADYLAACARAGIGGVVCTVNAGMAVEARENAALAVTLRGALLNVADGKAVSFALRRLGAPVSRTCPGVELGEALLRRAAAAGIHAGFYGGAPGVAVRAAERLRERIPDLQFSFLRHGFDRETPPSLPAAAPRILFVCLGSPRQEIVARRLQSLMPHTLFLCLGGSLDVYAGRVRRAPRFFRRFGFEWLFRCLCEPRRFLRVHPCRFYRLFRDEKNKKLLDNS